ncbi:helix-turn-helix transcriptional regulator [Mobilicoccus massiliensis]|uniref:helix-turn-helix transcriptional regulator n=1 Tax=Mobilicoccus massiliensis TaxID=1522310 RepID=UPI00058FB68D|nr:hypothetical protein [Mobilicoccus massiliensis]
MAEQQPALLTIEGVEARTGIPVRQIRVLTTNGTGPPSVRLGKRRWWRAADVDAWIDETFAQDSH